MIYPQLQPTRKYNDMQDVFLGYNHTSKIDEREWFDMNNVSPRAFPLFAPREPRGTVKTLTQPAGILARDALVYVDGATLYVNDYPVTGMVLLTGEAYVPKKLISMGAYILVMPDKMYVNTADFTDYGYIESTFVYTGDVQLTPARIDGSDFGSSPIGVEPPLDPVNSQYWVDTSAEIHVLRQYSALSDTWTEIASTYTKVALPGIGAYFKKHDGVNISGIEFLGTDPILMAQIPALNGSKVLYMVEDDFIIIPGLLSTVQTALAITVTVSRAMPDMDFMTESENRVWGCKYGMVDGKIVNELYACSLGDFKNWRKFMGVSTDSYVASVGTDGKFTGAVTHLGYPIFFKETCLHKVYGNYPANYRVETTECRGVQEGSSESIAIVNESLLYKGRTDVLLYDGSLPIGIGSALGNDTYRSAVGGVFKERYYLSMADAAGIYTLFMYDTSKRLWYKEDNTKVMGFAQVDDELYYINAATNKLMAMFGKSGTLEGDISFMAQTGIIGYAQKDHKYISRLNIRAKLPEGSSLEVLLRYDSIGDWVLAGELTGTSRVGTTMMPIRPKRCDHFEMKLNGMGDARIFSIAKILEVGSDGRWS